MSKNIQRDAYQGNELRDGMLMNTHTGVGRKPGCQRPVTAQTEGCGDETS